MKRFLLFLLLPSLCLAQKITVEQIPTADVLRYLGIDPVSFNTTKFSVTYPSKKFAVLEWLETDGAKVTSRHRAALWLEPAYTYDVEVVALPFTGPNRTMRMISYKFSSEAGSIGGAMPVFFPSGIFNELRIGSSVPTVFKCVVGPKTYMLSLIVSDSPIPSDNQPPTVRFGPS
jgi:hypothetical protein